MIIFGSSREYTKAIQHVSGACPHCEQQNTLNNEVLMRYFHIWYIPFFPIRKRVVTICSHCKGYFESNTMPTPIAQQGIQMKKHTKYPLKYWSGLLLIGGLILLVAILGLT